LFGAAAAAATFGAGATLGAGFGGSTSTFATLAFFAEVGF
jgi:hypothetical protein